MSPRSLSRVAALACACGLGAGLLAGSGTALADPAEHGRPSTVVTGSGAHGTVRTAAAGADRSALLAGLPGPASPRAASASGKPGQANRNQLLTSTDRAPGPAGTHGGALVASGTSFAAVPYLNYYASFTRNKSKVAWTGATPQAADSITHTDLWQVDFFGEGFTVTGQPEGATVRGDGGSLAVKWTTTSKGSWYSEHTAPKLGFMPTSNFGQIYRIRHTVTATFHFGEQSRTVTSEARSYVW